MYLSFLFLVLVFYNESFFLSIYKPLVVSDTCNSRMLLVIPDHTGLPNLHREKYTFSECMTRQGSTWLAKYPLLNKTGIDKEAKVKELTSGTSQLVLSGQAADSRKGPNGVEVPHECVSKVYPGCIQGWGMSQLPY